MLPVCKAVNGAAPAHLPPIVGQTPPHPSWSAPLHQLSGAPGTAIAKSTQRSHNKVTAQPRWTELPAGAGTSESLNSFSARDSKKTHLCAEFTGH